MQNNNPQVSKTVTNFLEMVEAEYAVPHRQNQVHDPRFEPKMGEFIRVADSPAILDNNGGEVRMFAGKTKDGEFMVFDSIGVATNLEQALFTGQTFALKSWCYARKI